MNKEGANKGRGGGVKMRCAERLRGTVRTCPSNVQLSIVTCPFVYPVYAPSAFELIGRAPFRATATRTSVSGPSLA